MAGKSGREFEFAKFPKIKAAYIGAFVRMIAERKRKGLPAVLESGVDVFHWWMEDGVMPGQEVLDGFEEI